MTVEVITNDPKDSKKLFYRNKLVRDTDNADDLTSLELLYWKINNVPQEIVETVNSTADKPEFEITLHGEKSYLLERKTKSVYSMKVDPFKSFIEKNYIIDSMIVDISYPVDLKCQFWGIGTLEKFKSINTTSPNRIIRKYDGLIYKNQGFRIYFQAR